MTENLPVLILTKHVLLPYQELKLDYVMLQFGWLLDDEQEKTINPVLK